MSISSLKLFKVAVPLKKVVRHASFERSVSENLVVRVTLSDGVIGYGEGVPRSYVTGETLETAFAALESQDWARIIGRPSSFAEVVERVEALTLPEIESDPRGMAGNAALARSSWRCWMRTAAGSTNRWDEPSNWRSVEGLELFPSPRRVRYSGAITAESPAPSASRP